jgi:hypothetical protein
MLKILTEAIVHALKANPALLALITTVLAFLSFMYIGMITGMDFYETQKLEQRSYIEEKRTRDMVIHNQRIDQCHETQSDATMAMNEMARALAINSESNYKVQQAILGHESTHQREIESIEELIHLLKLDSDYRDRHLVH